MHTHVITLLIDKQIIIQLKLSTKNFKKTLKLYIIQVNCMI